MLSRLSVIVTTPAARPVEVADFSEHGPPSGLFAELPVFDRAWDASYMIALAIVSRSTGARKVRPNAPGGLNYLLTS